MSRIGTRRVLLGTSALPYSQKVLTIAPANLIGYWKLNETAGATAVDSSTQGNNGTYTGVDLANAAGPDGVLVPYFDGANDTVSIYSAGLAADFSGLEGTFSAWIKVANAGVWTDGQIRLVMLLYAGEGDRIYICRNGDNTLDFQYDAGSTNDHVASTAIGGSTTWNHVAMTWSDSADELKAYINGSQVGLTQTTLGNFAGVLSENLTQIGSYGGPALIWSGWLAHAALWNTPLTGPQILSLATV